MAIFGNLFHRLRGDSHKESAELGFQRVWAKEFLQAKDAVREYWEKNRHLARIVETAGIGPNSRVLDVGCGISTVLHFLEGERIGVDPLAHRYKELYDYPDGIKVLRAPGEALPFQERTFDFVNCSNVLDHTDDPGKVVAEVARVLPVGGHFLLTVDLHDEEEERDAAHPHSLDRDAVLKLVDRDFELLWEESSPWIGVRRWARGERTFEHQELILMLRRRN